MEKSAISEIQQAANASIKTETGTSSENENQNERLVSAISEMFEELEPSVSIKCCMYKVPHHLRTLNPKAYTPQVISIGPYHHNNENCQTMEKQKVRYFRSFMEREMLRMEDLVSTIRKMENEIRSCYIETVQLKSDDFVKMIMLDACFIIELFRRRYKVGFENDYRMAMEAWLLRMVSHDLFLLENQLPFFVIEYLYNLTYLPNSISLIELTFGFFNLNICDKALNVEIQHFTDLLRFFLLPPTLPDRVPSIRFPQYSVTQLHEAGVKFKVVSRKCLLDFKFKRGVLEIPCLLFQDDTETLLRNIIALEQCDYTRDAYITDFCLILECLVNSTKDVDLLSNQGILINGLGNNNAVTSMIQSLNRGIFNANMNSDFRRLSEDLNKHYEQSWQRWKAILRQQYPTMAFLGLVLTLIQTVLTILQLVL